jgi:predicted lipoprotein with Yx(FWY)xxD motif
MKAIAYGIAALLIGTAAAYAKDPAKVMNGPSGKIYTTSKGMTLYTFDKDAAGKSTCDGDCAVKWPPFKAAKGAKASGDWSIVKRSDGSSMWAYEGKPLYTFADDKKAGEVTGDGKGGVWHVAKAD